MTDVRVQGAEEYLDAARRFNTAVRSDRFGRTARVSTAQRVTTVARVEAPARTGTLARSIGPRTTGDDVTVMVDAAHGGPVHAGRRAGRRGGRMAPNLFLDRALRGAEDQLARELDDELHQLIDRTF